MKTKLKQNYHSEDGRIIKSVTQIIGDNLGWNKAALIAWSKGLAQKGENSEAVRDIAADIGTIAHKMVEEYLKLGEIKTDFLALYGKELVDKAQNSFKAFLDWAKVSKPKMIYSELKLISDVSKYGGTVDLIVKIKDEVILLDIKTSKAIYPDHLIQISAYNTLCFTNAVKIDKCAIIRLDKETGNFEYHNITEDSLKWGREVFSLLLKLDKLRK